jgi:NAD+ synthase
MDKNKEINNIAKWMKEYQENSGCEGYVCGISGGIDSAVVSALCCKSVGKGKFIGIYLPCESSPNMEDDAIQLAENLGIELRVFNLIDSYNAIIQKLEEGGETVSRLTKANTKARLRMTMLFAIANQYNYLVAGTGNKSELDIGYCTYGGDSVVSNEPLGNFYKTEVYKMAELMPEMPKSIIDKPASADLWDGQTDEQEIGMTYKEIDAILLMIDSHSLNKDGLNEDKIEKVRKMINKAKYKNRVPSRYSRKLVYAS